MNRRMFAKLLGTVAGAAPIVAHGKPTDLVTKTQAKVWKIGINPYWFLCCVAERPEFMEDYYTSQEAAVKVILDLIKHNEWQDAEPPVGMLEYHPWKADKVLSVEVKHDYDFADHLEMVVLFTFGGRIEHQKEQLLRIETMGKLI